MDVDAGELDATDTAQTDICHLSAHGGEVTRCMRGRMYHSACAAAVRARTIAVRDNPEQLKQDKFDIEHDVPRFRKNTLPFVKDKCSEPGDRKNPSARTMARRAARVTAGTRVQKRKLKRSHRRRRHLVSNKRRYNKMKTWFKVNTS